MYFNSIDIVNERDFLLDEDWAEIEAEKNTACHVIIKILLGSMTFWNPGKREQKINPLFRYDLATLTGGPRPVACWRAAAGRGPCQISC